jgi:hypothetical protein
MDPGTDPLDKSMGNKCRGKLALGRRPDPCATPSGVCNWWAADEVEAAFLEEEDASPARAVRLGGPNER